MSQFLEAKTSITDIDILKESLEALCPGWCGKIEFSQQGLPLLGYEGDDRHLLPQSDKNYAPLCQLKISKKFIGGASNDIGFSKNPDGTYSAHISEYDHHVYGEKWLNALKQTCTVKSIEKLALKKRVAVKKANHKTKPGYIVMDLG